MSRIYGHMPTERNALNVGTAAHRSIRCSTGWFHTSVCHTALPAHVGHFKLSVLNNADWKFSRVCTARPHIRGLEQSQARKQRKHELRQILWFIRTRMRTPRANGVMISFSERMSRSASVCVMIGYMIVYVTLVNCLRLLVFSYALSIYGQKQSDVLSGQRVVKWCETLIWRSIDDTLEWRSLTDLKIVMVLCARRLWGLWDGIFHWLCNFTTLLQANTIKSTSEPKSVVLFGIICIRSILNRTKRRVRARSAIQSPLIIPNAQSEQSFLKININQCTLLWLWLCVCLRAYKQHNTTKRIHTPGE